MRGLYWSCQIFPTSLTLPPSDDVLKLIDARQYIKESDTNGTSTVVFGSSMILQDD